jgi:hypothetical protein
MDGPTILYGAFSSKENALIVCDAASSECAYIVSVDLEESKEIQL